VKRGDLHPTTEALVAAVQAEFGRVLHDIGPKLDQRPEPQFAEPEYRNIQAAQNALRTCLEGILERLVPYSGNIPLELAIRLASYAISALPIEDQEQAVRTFIALFPQAHAGRIRQGIGISTEWVTDGRVRANVPR
jgi:hypothetical protein